MVLFLFVLFVLAIFPARCYFLVVPRNVNVLCDVLLFVLFARVCVICSLLLFMVLLFALVPVRVLSYCSYVCYCSCALILFLFVLL